VNYTRRQKSGRRTADVFYLQKKFKKSIGIRHRPEDEIFLFSSSIKNLVPTKKFWPEPNFLKTHTDEIFLFSSSIKNLVPTKKFWSEPNFLKTHTEVFYSSVFSFKRKKKLKNGYNYL
jgi:hypothetical protein